MRRTDAALLGQRIVLEQPGSDEYVKALLDHFVKQVDNQIYTELVSEIMERYVDVSRQLEIKSRELEKSDSSRREAQEIALIGNWELSLAQRSYGGRTPCTEYWRLTSP